MRNIYHYNVLSDVTVMVKDRKKMFGLCAANRYANRADHHIFFHLGSDTSYAIYSKLGELLMASRFDYHKQGWINVPLFLDVLIDVKPILVSCVINSEDPKLHYTLYANFRALTEAYVHLARGGDQDITVIINLLPDYDPNQISSDYDFYPEALRNVVYNADLYFKALLEGVVTYGTD